MTAQELTQETVVETLRGSRFLMLTTVAADGSLLAHPMTPQEVTDDADVWFVVSREGGQADALRAGGAVNLAVSEAGSWLSVAGTAEFVEDRAKLDELWDDEVAAYFEGGKDDPAVALLLVRSESAQYWGVPGGKVAALAKIVRAKVTGTRPGGASGTTEL